jgi:hypothetical protein
MEVKSITKQGVTNISDLIRIEYTVQEKGDGTVKSLNASILAEGECIGFYSADGNGASNFSLTEGNGLSAEQKTEITNRVYEDAEQVFGSTGSESVSAE